MAESLAGSLTARIRDRWNETLYATGFFLMVIRETLAFFRRRQVGYKVLVMQILFTGFEAMGVIVVIALALGAIINIIGSVFAAVLNPSIMYQLLVIIITRELGPVLTAFIIIARSGTAIATELGGMVVNNEIEAYMSFGINPISYLIVPRFLGVVFSMLLLTLYFNTFGLLGSYLISAMASPIPFPEYMNNIITVLKPADLIVSLGKAAVFGTIISLVSSFQGFSVQRSSTEIPQAGIRAVSQSFIFCIVADAIITMISYLKFGA